MPIKSLPEIIKHKASLFILSGLLTFGVVHNAMSTPTPAQSPLFLSIAAKPHVNLIMSKDEELFRKAYNDYSNLDGNTMTMADTTYRNDFEYYGYFDPNWCYSYSNNSGTPSLSYFTPSAAAGTGSMVHKCLNNSTNKAWSGNFLNWSTMTRIDIIRRVMFGGKRSVDTVTQTILERAYLPKDIHAFVKIYAGTDMVDLTPFTYNASTLPAISLCNVSTNTPANSGYPLIRIASGAWQQWSASEKQQCQYNPGGSSAIPTAPTSGVDLTAKVEACASSKEGPSSTRCELYGSNYKPKGILQKYGEDGNIKFSLITGSYKGHLSGGVLRRAASLIAGNVDGSGNPTPALDEINLTTGQFNSSVSGIIANINSFVIEGYSFSANSNNGLYSDCNTHSIPVATVKAGTTSNRTCSDWGNPLSEIYLEALRYITGQSSPVSAFNVDDTTSFSTSSGFTPVAGLTRATWGTDPWPADQWCAKCSTIILSTGANSFDGDELDKVTDLGLTQATLNTNYTDVIGSSEATFPGSFFAGGTTVGQTYCKPTSLNSLSDANLLGICPEQPALQGTYAIAGLAYWAHINDIRPNSPGKQTLTTYAVDLAESLPSFTVPVTSGGTTYPVTFLPACLAQPGGGNWQSCTLIDVKVESLTLSGGNPVSGSYLMFWEDSLWGNDYDFDGASRIQFCVGAACSPAIAANQIKITNSVPYANAGNNLQFSYNISGVGASVTTNVASKQSTTPVNTAANLTGFAGGLLTPWAQRPGGQNFDRLKSTPDAYPDTVTTVTSTFTVSNSSSTTLLQKPLFYTAKYGGFNEDFNASNKNNLPDLADEWDNKNGVHDGVPDNYFSVKNPADLEKSLNIVLSSIVGSAASASSAAVSSTRLSAGSFVYQARFNSTNWNGELVAYALGSGGAIGTSPALTTDTTFPRTPTGRTIYTSGSGTSFGSSVVPFAWANLTNTQKFSLAGLTYTAGATLTAAQQTAAQNTLNWITGDASLESTTLRDRTKANSLGTIFHNVLGDVVNSSPVYEGGQDLHYDLLSSAAGGNSYATYLQTKKAKTPRIFIGSNDGMIHAFNANTLAYLFSYIPDGVYAKLANLSKPDYGTPANPHQYLMDGQITIGDAYFNGSWHSVLVAALGAGGKEVFALDITNPSVAPVLLFDFKYDANAAQNLTTGTVPSIGYVMGSPFIVPLKNDRFAVVFSNGYESGNGVTPTKSTLVVVDLESPTGSNTKFINAPAGSGLSTPELLPNNTGAIEYAYAGDLQGNLTKFNLFSSTPASWSSSLMFSAKDGSNNVQPISAAPTLGRNGQKNDQIMVYFGTGKYFEIGDTGVPTSPKHSMYAILDDGSLITRSNLYQKTIVETATARTITGDNTVTWATKKGWYLDFSTTAGERVTIKPLLLYDRLIFPTLIPSSAACGSGGSSWLMQVTAIGDKNVGNYLLNTITKSDYLILGDLAFGIIPSTDGTNTGKLIKSTSEGKIEGNDLPLPPNVLGRMNWRQLD